MTEKEEFEKHFMKYKKAEMMAWMWKIREKNRVLREAFESYVDKDTYREHESLSAFSYGKMYFKFKAAIATYLGEKIQ